jgi:hypothetical protein
MICASFWLHLERSCDLIQAYKNVGHTDAIIKKNKWNSIVYTFCSELVETPGVSGAEALLQGIASSF